MFKWDERGAEVMRERNEGADRARSESSRAGQILCCPDVAEVP